MTRIIASLPLMLALTLFGCMGHSKVVVGPANIFPEATEVRLYLNKDLIEVDEHGRFSASQTPTYPAGGIALTRQEIVDLRNAVTYIPARGFAMACCIPRHAFLFYDKTHKYLGSLEVCFECLCSDLQGMGSAPDGLDIKWDEAAIAHIVENHGQIVHFDEQPPA